MSPLSRTLSALSLLELASLLVLVTNLVTAHDPTVSSVVGPVHGAFYLAVAATALLGRGLSTRTRVVATLPVVSGPLTFMTLRRETQPAR